MIDSKGFRANVGIILSNSEGKVFWARRAGQKTWQFPQGGIDEDESPIEAMYRELHEETGIKATKWEEIMQLDLSNSVTDEQGIVYIAKDLSFHEPEPDDDEQLEIKKLPFSECHDISRICC